MNIVGCWFAVICLLLFACCQLPNRLLTNAKERDLLVVLATQDSTALNSEASMKFTADELHSSAEDAASAAVDFDAISRDQVAPGGTGTLTNFLIESNEQRAKAGARLWGWMYEDVEDIKTGLPSSSPTPSTGETAAVRTRSHTTPARMPEGQPSPQIGGKQPGAAVSFADDEPAPEPDPESTSRTQQP
jgi:hypothetical protein